MPDVSYQTRQGSIKATRQSHADRVRFKGDVRCPVCNGAEDDPRGIGERCFGWKNDDGIHCTRGEYAGGCKFYAGSQTYFHSWGVCPGCGCDHGPGPAPIVAAARKGRRGRIARTYDYPDRQGELLYRVVRYDPKGFSQQRPDGKGGWISDLNGVEPVLYRLPELADHDGTILIVEGEKDADRLTGLGFTATTNPMGAGKWRDAYSDCLSRLGADVIAIPDADAAGRGHAEMVCSSLAARGMRPKILELPGLPTVKSNKTFKDVSDWLDLGHTGEELRKLMAGAPAWEPSGEADERPGEESGCPVHASGGEILPNEAPDDPHRLARIYRDQACMHPDGLTLVYCRDEWHRFDGSAYSAVPMNQMKAEVSGVIKSELDRCNVVAIGQWEENGNRNEMGKPCPRPKARPVTGEMIGNVLLNLSGLTLLDARVPQPSWLGGDGPFPAGEMLPARNCLVHLPSFVADLPGAIVDPTPRFFSSWSLDYDFLSDAPSPVEWTRFLESLWPDDRQSIDTLQEWFGYMLTPDTRQQKIGALIGPKRSGKGTIARVLQAMIGPSNVASPTLAGLASHFGLAPLIGKPLAIISDARISGRTDQASIVENLLRISGEDSITIDRKHVSPWTGKLHARILLLANELPRLSDSSGALAGRLILLRFVNSFYGREDPGLTGRLLTELPAILLWSIAGWKRLMDRGRFVQPDSGREMIAEMEDLASPVGAFLRERCIVGPGCTVRADDLYEAWRRWCEVAGRKYVGTIQDFGRDLRAVLPCLEPKNRRQEDGTRKRCYEGIELDPMLPSF